MGNKLEKSTFPAGHTASDFQCFGPPATKDGAFEGTCICDMGCFTQDGKDSNKYYHSAIVQSKIDQHWGVYNEYGRTGAKNPQYQYIACSSKADAESEYVKVLMEKNVKRGQWVQHPVLGKILQAKPGKDCYLVRPQATRSTGLPDAKTIKLNENKSDVIINKVSGTPTCNASIDMQTLSLMKDLNVATISYTRGAMTDDSLPTLSAINEVRDILGVALNRISIVGNDIDDQLRDREITQLTNLAYGRIPKKKDRNAPPKSWLLTKDNILSWQQDLDAFESALSSVESVEDLNPFGGMQLKMDWISPKSPVGEFLYFWAPKATRNKHNYLRNMQIKNVWSVERKEEQERFEQQQNKILDQVKGNYEKPFHQPTTRPDINNKTLYDKTNTCLLMHGSRSVNISGLLKEGFRFPRELVGVTITGAMFSGSAGGIYMADDWMKSAGYTSLSSSYYSKGSGSVANRGAFIILCDALLGVPHVAPKSYPYVSYPAGTHSIMGKAGVSGVQNNEYIVLNKSQCKMRYLIEFVA